MTHRTHSRTAPRAAALLLAGALAACSHDAVAPTASADLSTNDLKAVLVAQGYRADMIQDFGGYFLVEGDISFDKSVVRAMAERGPLFQYTTHNLVSLDNVGQITVDVSSVSGDWQAAARSAMVAWSSIPGSSVHMTEQSGADITFTSECRGDNILARVTSFPVNGKPSSQVIVNDCWVVNRVPVEPSASARLHTVVHELGHSIGFRHTNWNQVDCSPFSSSCGGDAGPEGANRVPGTPPSGWDPASVMNGGTAGNAWNGFSSYDEVAARTRYPLRAPFLSTSNPFGTVVLTATSTNALGYEVRRIDRLVYDNYYEGWRQVYDNDSGWSPMTSNPYDTGSGWTGTSYCLVRDTGYEQEYNESWYEVRAVYANGIGPANIAGTEDLSC